ncbi:mandelate racemase/muconate lactonizing enzyme family protein [Kribbella turkmenica]|uniref:Mandelate racemase/muconate lactonizing enzyme family protein n=1 Tax=Kribbella turkmenica TaxID=2530375 RepID=A0A4V6PD98_9ACTN|nr:mandelate racemase/muconate lactonizing enzyme family protein [Kribbella turkmenica]TDD26807.1 mandelate racemase/muconate lactonizing enzyme family protein [Kribbella turkmenica]
MLIAEVEVFVLKLRGDTYLGQKQEETERSGYFLREPWRSLYSGGYETVLVRLVAEDGTSGWGEALAPVGPEIVAAAIRTLLAPVVLGSVATRPRPTFLRLRDLMRERGHLVGHQADALAAVDIALWDLAGRVSARPVSALMGGALRDEVPVYVSGLPESTRQGRRDLAKRWLDDGATTVKLHLGHGIAADLETVDDVIDAAPGLTVAVDAHWRYQLPEALRLSDALAERGVAFLEAPLNPEDVDGHRRLALAARLPIAVGESLRNRFEADHWLTSGALHLLQPDVGRTGLTEGMAMTQLAAARHVAIAPHHSSGLGIALAAGIQLSAVVEDLLAFEYQPTSVKVGASILTDPLVFQPAAVAVPSGPGLGVEIDYDAVSALAEEY